MIELSPLEVVLFIMVTVLYVLAFRWERMARAYHRRLSALNFAEAEIERLAAEAMVGGER